MYQVLTEEVYDSKEISELLQGKGGFTVREDMTGRTKREDAIAFKLSISVEQLKPGSERYIEDVDCINELMEEADKRLKKALEELSTKELSMQGLLWSNYAYTYNEVDHEILLVAAVMGIEKGRRKLPDVMKRLLSQV